MSDSLIIPTYPFEVSILSSRGNWSGEWQFQTSYGQFLTTPCICKESKDTPSLVSRECSRCEALLRSYAVHVQICGTPWVQGIPVLSICWAIDAWIMVPHLSMNYCLLLGAWDWRQSLHACKIGDMLARFTRIHLQSPSITPYWCFATEKRGHVCDVCACGT